MTKDQISLFLKQLRKTSGLTANDVVNNLKSYDIDISAKTLYGYESGLSMPNADTFVSLCRIYKCDNPLDVFGTPTITSSEIEHIEKYRALDPPGQSHVDTVLTWETERMEQIEQTNKQLKELTEVPRYMQADTSHYVNAAHPLDGASEEDKQFDEDIMDDENF